MPLTGAIFEGRCLASPGDAIDAFYSNMAPALTSGTTSYLTVADDSSGIWKLNVYSIDGSGNKTLYSTVNAPTPTFAACDPTEQFTDGVTVGWGIAAIIIVAVCIKMLEKGL